MSDRLARLRLCSLQSPLVRLTACGVASVIIYLCAFTLLYPFNAWITRPLEHFGRITGPSVLPTVLYVGALIGLFATYVEAVAACRHLEREPRSFTVVAGVGILSAIVLLPLYPLFSLDIFYYMSADRIWSVYHENPFIVPPLQGAHDSFFPYNAWGHYPLPYGPLWPWITRFTSWFGGGDIARTLLGFKTLSTIGYLGSTAAIAWAVGAIRPERRLTAVCTFAWNPLVLIELVGNGHNDAVCLIPAILSFGLWARRRSGLSTFAVTVSFVTKATVAIAIPALLTASLRRALAERRLGRWLWMHVVPPAALYVIVWLPFNRGNAMGFLREADQYYQSVTALIAAGLPPGPDRGSVLRLIQLVLVSGFAAFYVSQLRALTDEGRDALRAIWRIFVVYFLIITPFFSPWYIAWPTMVAALGAEARITRLTTLLCIGGLSTYLVQFVVRPAVGPTVPVWVFGALGLAVAVAPFLAGLIATRPRRAELQMRTRARSGAPEVGA